MKRWLTCCVICLGTALAMVSDHPALQFAGGMLVALDEQNRMINVYDVSGKMLEQKQLTSIQYQFLRRSWTTGNSQLVGLSTTLKSATPMFSNVKSNSDGRQLRIPYGNMTYLSGSYYKAAQSATTPTIPANMDSTGVLVATQNMNVQSVIQPSGRVFISAPEVRLKNGFNAKWGSEVRIVAQ